MPPDAVMRVVWFFGARVAGSYEDCARFSVQVPIHASVVCAATGGTRDPTASRTNTARKTSARIGTSLPAHLPQPRLFVYKPSCMIDSPGPAEITRLLVDWRSGDQAALQQLIPLVHEELRRLARRHMAHERVGHTLQATALVNEAFVRLIDVRRVKWQD